MQYPVAPPAPATDDLDGPRLVLRDGSVASVRIAGPADRDEVRRFFRGLSRQARHQRFLTAGEPADAVLDQFSAAPDPTSTLTLLASHRIDTNDRIIAVASYAAVTKSAAEVAFAVDDRFHGKGVATLLLERLAAHAAANGFTRFLATTFADNASMLGVFRDSGFEIRSKSAAGCVDVHLSLTPSAQGVQSGELRRRLATVESLRPMLAPRSVAVIGASRDRMNIGSRILAALKTAGFTGALHVVHPHATEIQQIGSVSAARDLPPGVDLAIVAVPQPSVLSAVDDCAAAGVRALVVISAGFAETGSGGTALQQQLVERVRACGMRMVGPNCMGLLNTDPASRLNASFSPVFPSPGRVALSSQSGALGIAILAMAAERHIGLSQFVSIGNKADVSSNDLLEYWEADPNTGVVLLYLESFGNPRRFTRIARRVARSKPIVAIKAARTRAGTRAAGSHTAALFATDEAVDALFRQSGVIRAETIDEMFDIAACLDGQPLPKGNRVAIVTNAGGPGILAVDACEAAGLTVVDFSSATRETLKRFLPSTASLNNPVDMVASAGGNEYRQTIECVLAAPETDSLVVVFTPVDVSKTNEILEGIRTGIAAAREAGASGKPVLACLLSEGRETPLRAGTEQIPVYRFPENAVRALGRISAYSAWRFGPVGLFWSFDDIHADQARAVCRQALDERGAGWLTAEEVSRVLHAFGVSLVAGAVTQTADDAAALASVLGFPVVAKLSALGVQHKSDIGAVHSNLASGPEVRKAFADISACARPSVAGDHSDGVLIQPMVTGGVETIVGVVHDPLFGPLVGFGIGGINVELTGDVRFRVAPLTDQDADELLNEIRGARLLQGYRGRPAVDRAALHSLLLRISRLVEEVHAITELDLNPVIALPEGHGYRVVDARIRVDRSREGS